MYHKNPMQGSFGQTSGNPRSLGLALWGITGITVPALLGRRINCINWAYTAALAPGIANPRRKPDDHVFTKASTPNWTVMTMMGIAHAT